MRQYRAKLKADSAEGRTCSEAEMREYLAGFLAGSLCVGYSSGIDESRMRGWLGGRSNISYFDLGVKYMYSTSGRAITGPNGIVQTPSSSIGFLMEYLFGGDEVLLTRMGGPDLDELVTRRRDSDELLDAFRVMMLYRILQDVSGFGQE
ncbi:hypothetical protein BGZ72_001955 [Mortierella alpina]|nr:hypothetical protein BGZ72_001955 [Mortierella alpina]